MFAFGGRENDLGLFDIEKQESIFTARNVPNDFLDLRVPVWVSDMQVGSSLLLHLVPLELRLHLQAGSGHR